jgi:heme/copper-type cytochrome/quinol oxidase subunit 2
MSLFGAIRSTVVLGWLTVMLLSISLTLGLWAFQLTATVAVMTANAASMAIRHRKEMARAVAKAKAKARLRRVLVAIPFVGVTAVIAFEAQDYQEWQEENPGKTSNDYACEVSSLSAEVMDEVLQELPESLRPPPSTILKLLPECREDEWAPI